MSEGEAESATGFGSEANAQCAALASIACAGPAAHAAAELEAQRMPGALLKDRNAKQWLDALTVTRDKILRVIGRDPKAGEQQAREWLTGPDPDPLFAMIVFKDMGDHEEDLLAAKRELHREVDAELKPAGLRK